MTTTELIKILQDNETGAISLKPREISLTINGRYMPNPQITLSSTCDGICGAEIDLDINGEWLEQEPVLDKIRTEIEQKIEQERFARSVFRGEEKDDVKAEQCTGSIFAYDKVIEIIDKYKAESEDDE